MQLSCPCCGAHNAVEAFVADEHARRMVKAAVGLPGQLGETALLYVGMFRPRNRRLAWRRAAKLMEELAADVGRGTLQWKGRTWQTPPELWRAALEQVLNAHAAGKITLPLESHGYLHAVLAGIADRADAEREKLTEERRRRGIADDGQLRPATAPDGTQRTRELRLDLQHWQRLLEARPGDEWLQGEVARIERQLGELEGGRGAAMP